MSSPGPDSLMLGEGDIGNSSATRVGINTSAPKTTLQISKGDLYIETGGGRGIILRSISGHSCALLRVDDSKGTGPQLKLDPTTCP
jgi:hypothetical protein